MNDTKCKQYLHFFANLGKEIVEKNITKRTCLHSKRRQVIKKYGLDLKKQLLYLAQKKIFDYIKKLYASNDQNNYKKILQQVKTNVYNIKFINARFWIVETRKVVERANMLMKHKIL